MLLVYRIVNVFTVDGQALTGNPLAVFEDGSQLSSETMQALALQLNLSETTFVLPSNKGTAGVRIFTPRYEMPFAGHPTLGTAHVVREIRGCGDKVTLDMPAGVIPVVARGNRWTLSANAPTYREVSESKSQIAKALGVMESDIGDKPLWVSTGREQLIVPLTSEAAVRRAAPIASEVAQFKSVHGGSMAYVFAKTGEGHLLARFFFPNGSALLEDPATGSATANLGGWYLAMGAQLPLSVTISQGEYTGRPSRLMLTVTGEKRIEVTGEVIGLGMGTIEMPR